MSRLRLLFLGLMLIFIALVAFVSIGFGLRLWNFDVFPKSDVHNQTNAQLEAWYKYTNETYFGTTLPKNVTVQWADMPDLMGFSIHREDGSWLILVDRRTNAAGRSAEFTVDHEMCHIAEPDAGLDSHGQKWQACMLRLAEAGAFHDLW